MSPKRHHARLDRMGVAYRARLVAHRSTELDTELQGRIPRSLRCGSCETAFVAAEINPTCPACGAILNLRRRA